MKRYVNFIDKDSGKKRKMLITSCGNHYEIRIKRRFGFANELPVTIKLFKDDQLSKAKPMPFSDLIFFSDLILIMAAINVLFSIYNLTMNMIPAVFLLTLAIIFHRTVLKYSTPLEKYSISKDILEKERFSILQRIESNIDDQRMLEIVNKTLIPLSILDPLVKNKREQIFSSPLSSIESTKERFRELRSIKDKAQLPYETFDTIIKDITQEKDDLVFSEYDYRLMKAYKKI